MNEDCPAVGDWAGRVLYHGTSESGAQSLLTQGVLIDRSSGGYFGRGFYVAYDKRLAAANYAEFTDSPEVLSVRLSPQARIWDMRSEADFQKFRAVETRTRLGIGDPNFHAFAVKNGCDGVYDNSFEGLCIYNPKVVLELARLAEKDEYGITDADRIQVSEDGGTVWVHGDDGSTLGRFSKSFGMDIHRSVTEQMKGAGQCLHCTHEAAGPEEWAQFCALMEAHFKIKVPLDAVAFEAIGTAPRP